MDGLDFAFIEEDERLPLEEFTKEEVVQVLGEMEGETSLTLRTFTLSVWWVVCISCCPRCWLTSKGRFWIISSLRLKIRLLAEGKF